MILSDKVAIITGGTGGLGVAVTGRFLEAGANGVVASHSTEKFNTLKGQWEGMGGACQFIETDVLDEDSVRRLVAQVLDRYGKIDILANLVGGFLGGVPLSETTLEQWERQMSLNLKSAFLCSKQVFNAMKQQRWGRIINVGSKGGLQGTAGMSAYSAAKAGVINLTQSLAEEGREHDITANVVIPSIIDTPDNRKAMPDADFDRWVKPESIADVLVFLSSETAGDVSGAVVPVFGKA